jgi:hypothetical protein
MVAWLQGLMDPKGEDEDRPAPVYHLSEIWCEIQTQRIEDSVLRRRGQKRTYAVAGW